MVFKIIVLSLACILIVQPAQCGIISKISDIKTAAMGAASDLVHIVPDMIRAKGSAVVQGVAQTGNIIAVGAGMKVKALEHAVTSMTDAVANGLISIGRHFSRKGTGMVEYELDNTEHASMGQGTMPDEMGRIVQLRHPIARPHYRYRVIYTPRVYRGPHGSIRIE